MDTKRCIGCRWHMPHKADDVETGGQGMLCQQKNGKCPKWVVKWSIRYCGLPEVFEDEELLETVRL